MLKLGRREIDEATYERAYRLADNYADRVRQLELVRHSLYNVYRMARRPLLARCSSAPRAWRRLWSMADIHRFLRTGFESDQSVRDITALSKLCACASETGSTGSTKYSIER